MTDDKVTTYLAEVRERSDRPLGPGVGALPISNEAVRHLMESAADVPHLLAAVEAALKHHQPGKLPWCDACGPQRQPCQEVADIRSALLGEGETDAV